MTGLAAVLPAGGKSRRMGRFKPLLPLGDGCVLERAVRTFRDAGLARIVVVTGNRAEEVAAKAREAGAEVAHNPDHELGMFTSIQAGVRRLGEDNADHFFILPADTPLVRPETVRLLAETQQEGDFLLTCPTFLGQRGHPPLLHRDLRRAILEHDGTDGLRGVLDTLEAGQPDRVRELAVADSGILLDLDRPADYAAALDSADHGYPSAEECQALWEMYETPEPVRGHCRAVAEAARRMVLAMNQNLPEDGRLNLDLAVSAALAHDLCKGRPRHAKAGAEALQRHGFPAAADIVAVHPDLEMAPGADLTEREIVFLADKYVQGQGLVPLEARYQAKLDKYGADPEARLAIQGRLTRAQIVRDRMEQRIGTPLEDLLEVKP